MSHLTGKYRVLVSYGRMEFLFGRTFDNFDSALKAAKGEYARRRAAYDRRTGRRGMPPVVRVLRATETLE